MYHVVNVVFYGSFSERVFPIVSASISGFRQFPIQNNQEEGPFVGVWTTLLSGSPLTEGK